MLYVVGTLLLQNVKYKILCGRRYPLLFMLAEYLKFPVACKMFNTKFYFTKIFGLLIKLWSEISLDILNQFVLLLDN